MKFVLLLLLVLTVTENFGRRIDDSELDDVIGEILHDVNELKKDVKDIHTTEDRDTNSPPDENAIDEANGLDGDLKYSEFDPDQPKDGNIIRAASSKSYKLWKDKNNDGVVELPFKLDYTLPASRIKTINATIQYINSLTCDRGPKWVHDTSPDDKHYVKFFSGSGCFSYLGRSGDRHCSDDCQRLSIGYGCNSKGIIAHEMLHAMGFNHEQTRPDRDNYVIIHPENIINGYSRNFMKIQSRTWKNLNVPYDYDSIMQYRGYSFTKNGQPTITKLDGTTSGLGQRVGLSPDDITELRRHYGCNDDGTTITAAIPRTATTTTSTTTSTTATTTTTTTTTPAPEPILMIRNTSFDTTPDLWRKANFILNDSCPDVTICDSDKYATYKGLVDRGASIYTTYRIRNYAEKCDTKTYCMMFDYRRRYVGTPTNVTIYGKYRENRRWNLNEEGYEVLESIEDLGAAYNMEWEKKYVDITLKCVKNLKFYISSSHGDRDVDFDNIELYNASCDDVDASR